MKRILLLSSLFLFLVGCVTPEVTVNKNITITISSEPCTAKDCERVYPIWINVDYTTASDLDTKLEQENKPDITIPTPGNL